MDLSSADFHSLQLAPITNTDNIGSIAIDSNTSSSRDNVTPAIVQLQSELIVTAGTKVTELSELPQRQRQLGYSGLAAPLGVSRSRGLALVLSDMQHLGILDLEEDQEDEEEEEEEEDGMDTE